MHSPSSVPPRRGHLTFQQWAELPEDEPGEWVNGHLEEEEVATWLHEFVVSWLVARLADWLLPRGGIVVGSEWKLRVGKTRGRKPDLTVLLPGSPRPSAQASYSTQPPDLVVEVVSERPRDATRDRIDKLREYAAFGVRWYWIVDPRLRSLEIHELSDDGNYMHVVAESDGVISVPGLDGFMLSLTELWQRVDELEKRTPDVP